MPPTVIVEPSTDTPLVWFDIAIRGGAAVDPTGVEGLHHHAATLARRGAGARTRARVDELLDGLGASIDIGPSRDAISVSGLSLSRHLDALVDLTAEILAAPRFDADEHERLLRETPQLLDEIRDDDGALATRWLDWVCCPGHPYGRTALGTEKSIAAIDRDAARALWQREVTADNLVIGLAGDVDEAHAARIVDRLCAALPAGPRIAEPPPAIAVAPRARRTLLVDKPDRTQAQIRIGHLGPRYGDRDTAAIAIAEAIFGGLFSSRLMQEIRVKRGWSYGAGSALRRSRLPHWFEMWMAPELEVCGQAVEITLAMFADYAAHGPTDDEVEFARAYLIGAMPFHVATSRQRMKLAVRDAVFGLAPGYTVRLPEAVGELTTADVRAACARHLRPDELVTVAVTTAARARDLLASANAGQVEVVDHDSY